MVRGDYFLGGWGSSGSTHRRRGMAVAPQQNSGEGNGSGCQWPGQMALGNGGEGDGVLGRR
jgi:hypothetical protein